MVFPDVPQSLWRTSQSWNPNNHQHLLEPPDPYMNHCLCLAQAWCKQVAQGPSSFPKVSPSIGDPCLHWDHMPVLLFMAYLSAGVNDSSLSEAPLHCLTVVCHIAYLFRHPHAYPQIWLPSISATVRIPGSVPSFSLPSDMAPLSKCHPCPAYPHQNFWNLLNGS